MNKTKLHSAITAILMLLLPTTASGYSFAEDGIYYNINDDGASVSVTFKSTGFSDYSRDYSGDVIIPETVTHDGISYSVTAITSAFFYSFELTSVSIPNSITKIGHYAFTACINLPEIILPESVTYIGNCAFEDCIGLTEIVIPDGVTSMGEDPFFECTHLERVVLGRSLTSIGSFLFSSCTQLKDVTCLATTPPHSWSTLKFVDPEVYAHTTLHVPLGSLEAYKSAVFWKEFSNIVGDATADDPGNDGYGYDFKVDGVYYKVKDGNAVVTNNGKPNCYSGDVVIPDEVTHEGTVYRVTAIGDSVFKNCTALTSIDLGNSIDSIGMYAFQGCTGLTSITIPESVDLIFPYAFGGCTNIKTLIFNPVSYYYTVLEFADCPLETVIFGDHVQTIPSGIVHNKPLLRNVTIPNSVTSIGCFAFQNCTGLTQVTLPESLITIEGYVFDGCTSLTSITIPDAVTEIGNSAFHGCSALSELIIGNSLDKIGENAFENCTELTSVYFPNSVTTIGKRAFCNCSKLALVTLGSGVTLIGSMMTFGNCWQLKDMICLATTPPSFIVGEWNESSYYRYTTLHVLPESLEAYQSAFGWKEFYQILGDVVIGTAGDVNGDGVITIADANSVIEVIINGGNKGHGHNHAPMRDSEEEEIYGDVNGDGVVSIADLNFVIDIILEH